MDAIKLLTRDHDEVKAMFRQYEEAGKGAKKTKEKIVNEVIKELQLHMRREEEVFYPAVRERAKKGELAELVLEGIEEHRVAKYVVEQLQGVGLDDETADAKFKVLMESVEHHVKEEEKQMFPEVKKLMGEELERLGTEMEQIQAAPEESQAPQA